MKLRLNLITQQLANKASLPYLASSSCLLVTIEVATRIVQTVHSTIEDESLEAS
jgi:hypothetical protein